MSAPKHTPWNTAGLRVSDTNGRTVAIVERDDAIEDYQQQRAEAEALARLIAAVPEMLDMLRYLADCGISESETTEVLALIAKAEGRTP